jgi:hypothetical protein
VDVDHASKGQDDSVSGDAVDEGKDVYAARDVEAVTRAVGACQAEDAWAAVHVVVTAVDAAQFSDHVVARADLGVDLDEVHAVVAEPGCAAMDAAEAVSVPETDACAVVVAAS